MKARDALLTRNQQAALVALNREGQAVVTLEKTSDLDGMDPQINLNTARVLVQRGLTRFDVGPTAWEQDGLWLVPVKHD